MKDNKPSIKLDIIKNQWLFFSLLIFIFLVLLISITYTLYQNLGSAPVGNEPIAEPINPFKDLKGKLYVTLASEAGDRNGQDFADTDEYVIDIQSGKLSKAIPGDDTVKITSKVSPDGTTLAYTASPYDAGAPENFFFPVTEESQFYLYNFSTKEKSQLTSEKSLGKRLPEWSPDERKIAFNSRIREKIDTSNPDNWQVRVTDLNGNIETIATGMQPLWSPEGRFILYVSSQGLNLYEVETGESEVVHGLGGAAITRQMKFDLSDDGAKFAWSDSKLARITLFEITSWVPFNMNTIETIDSSVPIGVFWPIFSPDNRYIVFQKADYNLETEELSNPWLRVYDTKSKQQMDLFDLNGFRFDANWLNDWVY